MNYLADHVAHAVLRGTVYRIIWHSPTVVVAGLCFLAAIWLLRRYP